MLSVLLQAQDSRLTQPFQSLRLLEGQGDYLPRSGAPWALLQLSSGRRGALENRLLADLQRRGSRDSVGVGDVVPGLRPLPCH